MTRKKGYAYFDGLYADQRKDETVTIEHTNKARIFLRRVHNDALRALLENNAGGATASRAIMSDRGGLLIVSCEVREEYATRRGASILPTHRSAWRLSGERATINDIYRTLIGVYAERDTA